MWDWGVSSLGFGICGLFQFVRGRGLVLQDGCNRAVGLRLQ